jgi:phosphoglycerate dehydrogenase-like enzyme
MPKHIVVLDPHPRRVQWVLSPDEHRRLNDMAEVIWGRDEPIPIDEFDRVKQDVFAVITCGWRFGSVGEMPELRAILEVGGGSPSPKHLDYPECFRRGIRVLNCAPAFAPPVAEMALGMALAASRGIVEGDRLLREGKERYSREGNLDAFTLYDKTVGLIGFGGLGRSLKPLLAPFRCRLQVYDPWLSDHYLRDQGVIPVDLDTLLSTSRVIFVLAIPSAENKAMLDRSRLELIQKNAVFVLISRAHVVDFDALLELVSAGRFRAAIDVFADEPVPADDPVRGTPGTVLSAHRGGHLPGDSCAIGRMVVNDLEAIIHGLPPMQMQSAQPEIISRML